MISFIPCARDFKKIQTIVGRYMPNSVVDLLENGISPSIKQIIIEHPYIDKDFRDTYYNDFSKRFADIARDSVRLHFFLEPDNITPDNYAGFVTLRDTAEFTLGRSYISPKAIRGVTNGYCCLARYPVQLRGIDLHVFAFPWMQQDGNISRCAHIAAWSIVRYFSQKYTYYPEKTLHEITAHDSTTRRIPSRGATVEQIAQIFRKNRFEPEIYFREILNETKSQFDRLVYTFIESGIPFVAGLFKRQHAVAVVGHGALSSPDNAFGTHDGIVDSADLIESILISDDNDLPYKMATTYEDEDKITVDQIDVVVVPFYEKMYLDAQVLYEKILPLLEANLIRNPSGKTLIRRVFMTSSHSLKCKILEESKDETYRDVHLALQMPKFVWIAEYANITEYKDGQVRARAIFDATMLNPFDVSFISLKVEKEICVYPRSKDVPEIFELEQKTERRYENNLRRLS